MSQRFTLAMQAAIFLQGYLWDKPRKELKILENSPYPARFTLEALSMIGWRDHKGKWELHEHIRQSQLRVIPQQ